MPKTKTFLLGMTCIVSLAMLSAQGASKEDVFESVPGSLRADLVERFNSLIEFRRTEQWHKLYDLISVEHQRGWSKTKFVRNHQQYPGVAGTGRRLIAFTARNARLRDGSDHDWVISGCAKLVGLRFPVDAFVMAKRENKNWYFSDLDALIPRDTPWRPCSFLKKGSGHDKRGLRHSDR